MIMEIKSLIGKRIRLTQMLDDPRPLVSGSMGTIRHIDSLGTIHVNWDNGRQLGVIPDVDSYEILDE